MPYVVNLRLNDLAKAQALAAILVPQHTIGNIVVDVRVLDGTGQIVAPMGVATPHDVAVRLHGIIRK